MGGGVDYTFNWFYVDGKDIGYQHSCKCPQRAPGVDPYLPVWGTGQWDWPGFIPLSAEPFDVNPPAGYLTSWNNKQAPGFKSPDRTTNRRRPRSCTPGGRASRMRCSTPIPVMRSTISTSSWTTGTGAVMWAPRSTTRSTAT